MRAARPSARLVGLMDGIEPLVKRARAGSREAFGRLFALLGRPVLLHLIAILRDREDADDALQTTFLRAWTRRHQLRDDSRFVPWLFRIARNTAHDLGRRARDSRAAPMFDEPAEPHPADPHPASADVRRAMEALRPETRALVLLRAVQGWSTDDVAAALGVHPATARRRYARAIEHLRVNLERSQTHDART